MNWKDEDLPPLRELESTVLRLWMTHRELNNYNVGRAYEAAYQLYRARVRGREPKPPSLDGVDLAAFHAVRDCCEKLLASGAEPIKGLAAGNTQPVPAEKLVEYLRELARSVERHTRLSGRYGYLEVIRKYVP